MKITLSTNCNKDNKQSKPLRTKTPSPPVIHSIPITYSKNPQTGPTLYQTIINKDIGKTKALLSNGANPDQYTVKGETPLYIAIEMNLVAQVKLLLKYNANPNFSTLEGITPLMCAVKKNNVTLVTILLDNKAILNLKDLFEEQTALHIAFKLRVDIEIIRILIQHGASLISKDNNGKAPIDYADKTNEELMNFLIMHNLSFNDDNLLSHALSPFSSLLSSTSGKKKKQDILILTPEKNSITNYKDDNPFTFEKDLAVFSSVSKPHPLTNDFMKEDLPKDIISQDSQNKNIQTPPENNEQSIIFNKNSSSVSDGDFTYSPSKKSQRYDMETPNKALQDTDQSIEFEFSCGNNSNNKSTKRNSDSGLKVFAKKIAYHNTHSKDKEKEKDSHKENKTRLEPIPLALPLQSIHSLNNSLEEGLDSKNITNIFKNTDISTKAYSTNSNTYQTQTNLLNFQQQYFSNEDKINLGLNNYNEQTPKTKDNKSTMINWLEKGDLLNYWTVLNNDRINQLEALIDQAKKQTIKLTYDDIERLGIRKPGHIYRFILHIQSDAGLFDMKLLHLLFGKKHMDDYSAFTMSNGSSKCNCCFLLQLCSKEEFDLKTWLNKRNLIHLKDHFVHNGFELFEYVLLQMFSSFPLDEDKLRDCLHIYNCFDNRLLLRELKKDCVRISQKYAIPLIGIESESEDYSRNNQSCELCIIF